MKEKRGFTLIELLAVIVILAIIALIATPIVLSLIEKARHGAAVDSAYGVRKEAQLLFQTTLMNSLDNFHKMEIDFSETMEKNGKTYVKTTMFKTSNSSGVDANEPFEVDGTAPTHGKITIYGRGKIEYEILTINSYYCCIPEQGIINCERENNFNNDCTFNGTPSNNPDPNPDNNDDDDTDDDVNDPDTPDDDEPGETYVCSSNNYYTNEPQFTSVATPGESLSTYGTWPDAIEIKYFSDEKNIWADYELGTIFTIDTDTYTEIEDIDEACQPYKYSFGIKPDDGISSFTWTTPSTSPRFDLSSYSDGTYIIAGRVYNKANQLFLDDGGYDSSSHTYDDSQAYSNPSLQTKVRLEEIICPEIKVLEANNDPSAYRTVLINYNGAASGGYTDYDSISSSFNNSSKAMDVLTLTSTTSLNVYAGDCSRDVTIVVPPGQAATPGMTITTTTNGATKQIYSGVYLVRNNAVNVSLNCAANVSDPLDRQEIRIVDGVSNTVLATSDQSTFSFYPGNYNLTNSAISILGICVTESGKASAANEIIFHNNLRTQMPNDFEDYACPVHSSQARKENWYVYNNNCGLGDLNGDCMYAYCGGYWPEDVYKRSSWCDGDDCASCPTVTDEYGYTEYCIQGIEQCEIASFGDILYTIFSERPTGYYHPVFGMTYTSPWIQAEAKDTANAAFKTAIIGSVESCENTYKTTCINKCTSMNLSSAEQTACESTCNSAQYPYCRQTFTIGPRHFTNNIYNYVDDGNVWSYTD